MKWLEGWLGTASGALGLLTLAITSAFVPTQYYASSCVSSNLLTTCSDSQVAAPGPNVGVLVLQGVVALLFIGVLVGTWLDLRGARRFGRIHLLTSDTFLLVVMTTNGAVLNLGGGQFTTQIYLDILLAFVTGILACVRRDAPRSATSTGE